MAPFALKADDQFIDSHQTLDITSFERPKCTASEFQTKALDVMKTYLENMPALSSISQRNKKLKIASLNDFEEVNISDFNVEDNYLTANALLMIKINKKVEEKDILLCKQVNIKKDPVYIIVYPYMDNFKANIINLDENQTDFEAISFIYP